MNSPNPVPAKQPASTTPTTKLSLPAKMVLGGTPLAVVVVWFLTTIGLKFNATEAAAIGSVGSAVIGYVWHVLDALVTVLLKKAGVTTPLP